MTPHSLFLLHLEDEGVEVLLQHFVTVVDAQLFKGIRLEGLKTKNVQHADERRHEGAAEGEGGDSLYGEAGEGSLIYTGTTNGC